MCGNQEDLQPLAPRVVRGAGWLFGAKLLERAFTVVKIVVLARLLSPEDFGLFGIVVLAVSTLEMFSQSGVREALVQRKEVTRAHLDTGWTVQAFRGLLLAALVAAGAPVVAWFFHTPGVVAPLRVMAVACLLRGFGSIGTVFFDRDLRFPRRFVLDVSSAALGLVVGVVLALRLRNVWALVWSSLAAEAARFVLSYVLAPHLPRPRLAPAEARSLYRFGRWVFAGTILIFLSGKAGDAFVGKLVGAAALGVYQIAYSITTMPLSELGAAVFGVVFPAYSRIQDEPERLRRAYLRVLENVLVVALPLAAFVGFFAPEIVLRVFGPAWTGAIEVVPVLAAAALALAVTATTGPVYYAVGRPACVAAVNAVRLVVLCAAAYPLTKDLGLRGTALAVGLAEAAALVVGVLLLRRTIGVTVGSLLLSARVGVCAGAALMAPPVACVLLGGVSFEMTVLSAALGVLASAGYVVFRKGPEWRELLRKGFGRGGDEAPEREEEQ